MTLSHLLTWCNCFSCAGKGLCWGEVKIKQPFAEKAICKYSSCVSVMSFMYTRNNKGPNTDPSGFWHLYLKLLKRSLQFVEITFYFVRNSPAVGQQFLWHQKLQVFWARFRDWLYRMPYSNPKNMQTVFSRLLVFDRMVSVTSISAFNVEFLFRKPYYLKFSTSHFSPKFSSLLTRNYSKTLRNDDNNEIGY